MSGDVLGHTLLRQVVRPGARSFQRSCQKLERVQRSKLAHTLRQVARSPLGKIRGVDASWSWEQFAQRMPITEYQDWAHPIASQMASQSSGLIRSPVRRYQPTSGSSAAIKWIPYTGQFLKELDGAIAPWLADLYQNYPGIRQGVHYWSLSWLPTDMRQESGDQLNDDMKLLSLGKRWLTGRTQAVPESVALAPTSDDSLFATLASLVANQNLSVMSVWSPTFALALLDKLPLWREELSDVLATGHWGRRLEALRQVPAPVNLQASELLDGWDGRPNPMFHRSLWPQLSLISAWNTAAAEPWARKLKAFLPQAEFQGKGLWATEGVVTIPQTPTASGNLEPDYVLAVNSHVYEFEDPDTGAVYPPWQLERGQVVAPLLTTGAGLLRYRLGDLLEVTGFRGEAPCLTFLGRGGTTDMVGEKISRVTAQQLLDSLPWPAGVSPVILLASQEEGQLPRYVLLADASAGLDDRHLRSYSERLTDRLEDGLNQNFHYQLARNLGQLAPALCICQPDLHRQYLEACRQRGMIEGNIKVEALRSWQGALPVEPSSAPITVRRQLTDQEILV